jgi:hypothetical protein
MVETAYQFGEAVSNDENTALDKTIRFPNKK